MDFATFEVAMDTFNHGRGGRYVSDIYRDQQKAQLLTVLSQNHEAWSVPKTYFYNLDLPTLPGDATNLWFQNSCDRHTDFQQRANRQSSIKEAKRKYIKKIFHTVMVAFLQKSATILLLIKRLRDSTFMKRYRHLRISHGLQNNYPMPIYKTALIMLIVANRRWHRIPVSLRAFFATSAVSRREGLWKSKSVGSH